MYVQSATVPSGWNILLFALCFQLSDDKGSVPLMDVLDLRAFLWGA
jgi:hypothetical protein